MRQKKIAVVLHSGGQDSTTCLALAASSKKFEKIVCVTFYYGQAHCREIDYAKESGRAISKQFGIQIDFLYLETSIFTQIGDSELLEKKPDVSRRHSRKKNLPASFVPNRNAMLLTAAHAVAQKYGALEVFTGVCQTDYSGYPDCRDRFIKSIEKSLNLGSEEKIKIRTPLMFLNKAQTFKLADKLGVLVLILSKTLTCYHGQRTRNDWGLGCGECPSCKLRKRGWEEFLKLEKKKC